ncbi:hypothetical protein TYRP_005119 [Tyrophagus putrescentiae]|nr:hypothetical protein TYRP_005119 [Tyrophagus putrescentiae]
MNPLEAEEEDWPPVPLMDDPEVLSPSSKSSLLRLDNLSIDCHFPWLLRFGDVNIRIHFSFGRSFSDSLITTTQAAMITR